MGDRQTRETRALGEVGMPQHLQAATVGYLARNGSPLWGGHEIDDVEDIP